MQAPQTSIPRDAQPREIQPRDTLRQATGRRETLRIRSGRMLAEWWSVLLVASALILAVNWLFPPVRADNLFYDFMVRLSPPAPSEDIVIVGIDNRSLAELGRWPWQRARHEALIEQLTAAGARAIGFDVLLMEPSPDDAALAEAIARNGRVVLPHLLEIPGANGALSATTLPVSPLAKAASATAHVVIRPDRDGVVRGVDRLASAEGSRLLHMAEAVVAVAGNDKAALRAGNTPAGGAILAPTRDLIRFSGSPGGYRQFSYSDVMLGRVPDTLLRGRIVLVGATAAGIGDRFSTPMSGTLETMAGVELHANYLDSLVNDRLIVAAPPWAWQIFSLMPVWLMMLSLMLLGPRINLWLGLVLSFLVFAVTVLAFAGFGFWLPPATALLALALIFPLWGWRRLDIASRYMVAELKELSSEKAILPREHQMPSGDAVERQMIMMHDAIRNVRDLRRFIAQSLDRFPDAALVTDLAGRVLISNDAADALFAGRRPGALEGQQLSDIFSALDADPRFPDPRATELLTALAEGSLPPEDGYETRLADGTSLEVRLAFFTDADRKALGWIARFADTTALRASERQREDALRLLTHDMRAPQASILAVLEAEGSSVPPEVARRLARYAHQTLGLADDFVHLARAESGRFIVETFNLSEALLDAADDLWPLAQSKQMRIATDVPEEEALVIGDRSLITRALANLLGNAIKYSETGTDVKTSVALQGAMQTVTIADRGRGISEADLPTLFEPFRRLAAPEGAAASSAAPGAGLGLAFVKAVVERHRGRVFATSVEGEGSVFGISLPAARL